MSAGAQLDPRFLSGMPSPDAPAPGAGAAASPTTLPPPVQTTPMFDPSGTVRQIPADQAPAALAAGGKAAYKMLDPSGAPRWIPQDSLASAAAAGGTPANMSEAKRIQAVLPKATGTGPMEDAVDTLHKRGVLGDQDVNLIREVAKTYTGVNDIVRKISGASDHRPTLSTTITGDPAPVVKPKTDLEKNFQEVASGPTAGKFNLGGLAETIGEWMAGSGEAEAALSAVGKMKLAMPVLQMAEKYPVIGKAIATAIKDGAIGGAQTYVKTGGDAGAAAQSALLTGGAGGVIEGAGSKIGEKLAASRLGSQVIGGVELPELSSQQEGGSTFGGASRDNTPSIRKEQDIKARQVVSNTAQDSFIRSIDRVNANRGAAPVQTNPARILEAPTGEPQFTHTIQLGEAPEEGRTGDMLVEPRKKQIGTTVEAGNPTATTNSKGVRKVPTFQYMSGARPGTVPREISVKGPGTVTVSDYQQATKALSSLDEALRDPDFAKLSPEDQGHIVDQHQQLSEALEMHHAARPAGPAGPTTNPRLNPIDPSDALPHIEHYGDAADQLEAAVKPVVQTLDRLSGDEFGRLREQQKKALNVLNSGEAHTKAVQDSAQQQADEAEAGMDKIFESAKHAGSVTPEDYAAFKSAWSDAQIFRAVHDKLEGAFNGVSAATEAATTKAGQPVSRKVEKLTTQRLGKIEQYFAKNKIQMSRIFGQEGFTNLNRVAALIKDPETEEATKGILHETIRHITRHVGLGAGIGGVIGHLTGLGTFEGAAAGATTQGAVRVLLHRIVTTPGAGKLLDYAARNGVTPKLAGGLIAATLNAAQNTGRQNNNTTGAQQ